MVIAQMKTSSYEAANKEGIVWAIGGQMHPRNFFIFPEFTEF